MGESPVDYWQFCENCHILLAKNVGETWLTKNGYLVLLMP